MKLRTFVAATFIGIIPATVAFSFFGSGLDSVLAAQEKIYRACLATGRTDCHLQFDLSMIVTPQLLAALATLGVIALIPVRGETAAREEGRIRSSPRTQGASRRALDSRWRGNERSELRMAETTTLTPDLCVIGAGSGGLSVAAAAAAFGVPVVLIEKGKMGGDCLNYGCVPSKALLAAAKHAAAPRRAGAFGLKLPRAEVDFAKVNAHVHGVIAAIAPNDSTERFTGLGVQVIAGAARFTDARTVAVGNFVIKARRFVVATGSTAAVPPIPGLDATPYLTNETIFDLKQCPEHLVIIGGGPIGLELAQAHRRLGASRDRAGGRDAARQGRSGMRRDRAGAARPRRASRSAAA